MTADAITLELLAPARDAATAIAAIEHGADAVYIGAPAFGARAAATNSLDDIARVVEAARPFGVRVYVTLNTIIYEHELSDARALVHDLYRIGVDALIVQDMALTQMDIPPIELHASTQTDSRTPSKIALMAEAGFTQIVVPREFTPEQIAEAAKAAPDARLEVFVHGALCVSYSGDCQAGWATARRSANRGECPQICRHRFTLTDAKGQPIDPDGHGASRHWLSLADMMRIDSLGTLADAGARSFKIEGRLKSAAYVKNITAAYSQALDGVIAASDGRYARSSFGRVQYTFTPDPRASFNRGFTRHFIAGHTPQGGTSWLTPKSIGVPVGKVTKSTPRAIEASLTAEIHNGDGLGWFDRSGAFHGFRVNRAEGHMLYPAPGTDTLPPASTPLYRNLDTAHEAAMARTDTARRVIDVDMTLRPCPDGRIALDATDSRGITVSVATETPFTDIARTPQHDARRATLGRLGGTHFALRDLDDRLGHTFMPASALTQLRRDALDALDRAFAISHRRPMRRKSTLDPQALASLTTTYHDNVANSLAARFYTSHGAAIGQKAIEVETPAGDLRVMTTRYCIRRELGACLRTSGASRLPRGPLYLTDDSGSMRLHFDCANCQMHLIKENKTKDS